MLQMASELSSGISQVQFINKMWDRLQSKPGTVSSELENLHSSLMTAADSAKVLVTADEV